MVGSVVIAQLGKRKGLKRQVSEVLATHWTYVLSLRSALNRQTMIMEASKRANVFKNLRYQYLLRISLQK